MATCRNGPRRAAGTWPGPARPGRPLRRSGGVAGGARSIRPALGARPGLGWNSRASLTSRVLAAPPWACPAAFGFAGTDRDTGASDFDVAHVRDGCGRRQRDYFPGAAARAARVAGAAHLGGALDGLGVQANPGQIPQKRGSLAQRSTALARAAISARPGDNDTQACPRRYRDRSVGRPAGRAGPVAAAQQLQGVG
jgi:hypothetical protein